MTSVFVCRLTRFPSLKILLCSEKSRDFDLSYSLSHIHAPNRPVCAIMFTVLCSNKVRVEVYKYLRRKLLLNFSRCKVHSLFPIYWRKIERRLSIVISSHRVKLLSGVCFMYSSTKDIFIYWVIRTALRQMIFWRPMMMIVENVMDVRC